jgi:hypothetical protein
MAGCNCSSGKCAGSLNGLIPAFQAIDSVWPDLILRGSAGIISPQRVEMSGLCILIDEGQNHPRNPRIPRRRPD